MASTVGSRVIFGTVVGTGSDIDISIPEFTPRKVVLRNVSSADEMVWVVTMPDAAGWKSVAAGTTSYVTTGGVTPREQTQLDDGTTPGRGFSIGTDADMNVASEVLHYEAHE
jgi:hypothetical protein